ncbi:MAG TPA: DNA replication/repair protein RecF [Alicyclobacillus sp.]|nr:DNA replication/repair protein RecF [Alicyclobacillus sp.]
MRLESLQLLHFRNYPHLKLDTRAPVNVFIGENGQGKTNVLEAIDILALTKSHRTHRLAECIQWGEQSALIEGRVQRKTGSSELSVTLTSSGKRAAVAGVERPRISDYVGMLNVVLFTPEDLQLIKGSPQVRRRFLDMEIGQISPVYLRDLQQYVRALSQRNQLLKSANTNPTERFTDTLDIWDDQLARHGSRVILRRAKFVRTLERHAREIHSRVSGDREVLSLSYAKVSPEQTPEQVFQMYLHELRARRSLDLARGMTSVGPHRDDLVILLNDREAAAFASQGQQRTAALSLKLAEIELIREEVGEYPVLLLDDVLSELDPVRQVHLVSAMGAQVQTFLTTTHLEGLGSLAGALQVFVVEAGQIRAKTP